MALIFECSCRVLKERRYSVGPPLRLKALPIQVRIAVAALSSRTVRDGKRFRILDSNWSAHTYSDERIRDQQTEKGLPSESEETAQRRPTGYRPSRQAT